MFRVKTKKFVSFLLTAIMIFSLFTMNISAAEEKVASIGDTYYNTVADALNAAVSGDTVIVQKDTTIREDVEVKAGVTLLVPYKAGYKGYDFATGTPDFSTSEKSIKDTLYRTLTVAEGVTMTVHGNILVSAMLGVAHGGSYRQEVNGAYAQIVLNGKMNVGEGGIVCANGYIKGTGEIEAFAGAEIRDLLVMEHWRGGTHASYVAFAGVWVANEYDFRNIQVELIINYGATLSACNVMYLSSVYTYTVVPFVSGTEGLFVLNEGSRFERTIEYRDRLGKEAEVYSIYGGGYFGSLTLKLELTLNGKPLPMSLSSSDYVVAWDGDNELNLYDGEYKTYFENKAISVKFLPGSEITIYDGAKLSVDRYTENNRNRYSQFVTYKELADAEYTEAYRYPQGRPAAKIIVKNGGELYVDGQLGGEIHLEENAIVTKGENAEFSVTTQESKLLKTNELISYTHEAEFIVDGYHLTGWDENNQLTWEKHTYSETADEVVEPTCTEKGYDKHICTYETCDVYMSTDVVSALGHSYNAAVTPPTCVDKGYTTYTCATCGDSYVTDYVPALGHTEKTVIENNVDPDCVNKGRYETVVYCTVCKKELSRVETIVDALGHTEETVVENNVDPDCVNTGRFETVVYCTVCKEELSRTETVVDAFGHTDGEAVIENEVAETCTTDGSFDTVTYCTVCDAETSRKTTVVSAFGHTYEGTTTPPTCTEEGYTTYVCATCGDTYEDDIVPANGHSWGEEIIDLEPTCTEKGAKHYVCTICEALSDTKAIPELGHVELSEEVKATCTEDGYKKVWCDVCEETLLSIRYDATGHDYEITETPPATDLDYGYIRYYCRTCTYEYTKEIDPLIKSYSISGSVKVNSSMTGEIRVLLVSAETDEILVAKILSDTNEFTFDKVVPGTYYVSVSKGNHVTKKSEIVLGEEDLKLDEISINLLGDITGDGKINTIDVARANSQAKGISNLSGYLLSCADVTGDGKVNTIDVARLNSHAKGVNSLW